MTKLSTEEESNSHPSIDSAWEFYKHITLPRRVIVSFLPVSLFECVCVCVLDFVLHSVLHSVAPVYCRFARCDCVKMLVIVSNKCLFINMYFSRSTLTTYL